MFYLKQYDTVLLSFEILEDPLEGQKCRIHEIDEAHTASLPIGMKKADEGLMAWLRSRIIPKNREYRPFFCADLPLPGQMHAEDGNRLPQISGWIVLWQLCGYAGV